MPSLSPEPKVHTKKVERWWCWEALGKRKARAGAMISQFREGAAALYLDLRVAWRHRHLARLQRRRLARRELLAVQRAIWDLVRVLPVLANPLPPPLGLSLIALAYKWPRWMLPPQFHSQDQRTSFARYDASMQTGALRYLAQSKPFRDQKDVLKEVFYQNSTRLVAHFTEPNGPLCFTAFTRRDLRRFLFLARPRLGPEWISAFWPTFVIRRILNRVAMDIDDDDACLLKSGRDPIAIRASVNALSSTDLLDACVARGLLCDNGDPEDRLVDWLARRVALDASWPQKHAPPAFIFCLAVLLHHPFAWSPSEDASLLGTTTTDSSTSLTTKNGAGSSTTPPKPVGMPPMPLLTDEGLVVTVVSGAENA